MAKKILEIEIVRPSGAAGESFDGIFGRLVIDLARGSEEVRIKRTVTTPPRAKLRTGFSIGGAGREILFVYVLCTEFDIEHITTLVKYMNEDIGKFKGSAHIVRTRSKFL